MVESSVLQAEASEARIRTLYALAAQGVALHPVGATVTPGRIALRFLVPLEQDVRRIFRLRDQVAMALGQEGAQVGVRGSHLVVSLPRSERGEVRLSALLAACPGRAGDVLLGLDAEDGKPVLADLRSPEAAHILVAGQTGAGKTCLLLSLCLSACWWAGPSEVNVLLLDPKGGADFAPLEPLPHVWGGRAVPLDGAVEALASAVSLMERRHGSGGDRPTVLVFADELPKLAEAHPEAEHLVQGIVARGRSAGVHVLAGVQRATADSVATLLKANFTLRLVGGVGDAHEAALASGIAGTDAHRQGKGEFVAVSEGRVVHRLLAAYPDRPEDCAAAILERRGRGGVLEFPAPGEVLERLRRLEGGDWEEAGRRLAERIRPMWEDGDSRRAMEEKVFHYAGGAAHRRVGRAVEWLERNRDSAGRESER